MDHAIAVVLSVFLLLCALVLEAAGFVDTFLAALMDKAGVDPHAQTLILIAVGLLLVVAFIRRLGGVLSLLILILLVMVLLRWALPGLHMPAADLPAGWFGGQVQI